MANFIVIGKPYSKLVIVKRD
ncbi:hypothetical protein PUN4_550013 [Paraburkholderia unamae]|nr:hypothetical protein PUN4_550013 [Paraburkholderia unamae]